MLDFFFGFTVFGKEVRVFFSGEEEGVARREDAEAAGEPGHAKFVGGVVRDAGFSDIFPDFILGPVVDREPVGDGAGLGGPVIDQLAVLAQNKYTVISMMGSAASPDRSRWYNARAYNFDSLREQMLNGTIDIDPDDKELFDEMMMLRYKFSSLGSIQIESKDDMRSRGIKSPDHLDSAVYATVDLDHIVNSSVRGKPGDKVLMDPEVMLIQDPFYTGWTW